MKIRLPRPLPDANGSLRLPPHALIAGERKCGTSSLFRYLMEHPQALPGWRKEPNLFAASPEQVAAGYPEYLQQFPAAQPSGKVQLMWPELDAEGNLFEELVEKAPVPGQPFFTVDASANTFHEADPALVREYLPPVRLILIFRDPVARAFSHHRMYRRFQAEGRDLGRPIGSFAEEMDRALALGGHDDFLAPGCYLENLRRWDAVFPRDQRLVLFAEDLDAAPQAVMDQVFAHLGISEYPYSEEALKKRYNQAPPAAPDLALTARLRRFYEPYDAALAAYLGRKLPWR